MTNINNNNTKYSKESIDHVEHLLLLSQVIRKTALASISDLMTLPVSVLRSQTDNGLKEGLLYDWLHPNEEPDFKTEEELNQSEQWTITNVIPETDTPCVLSTHFTVKRNAIFNITFEVDKVKDTTFTNIKPILKRHVKQKGDNAK